MESQDALNFINRVLSEQGKPVLNELEQAIFIGSWENENYRTIAGNTRYAETTLREVGANLWTKIKEALNIEYKINKNNFKTTIEHYSQNYPIENLPDEPRQEPEIQNNQNPFFPTSGRVENIKKISGREKEINVIFELLNTGNSVAIIGEPGIGKSSLLYALYQQSEKFLKTPRLNIFLDMNNIHNQQDFYFAICEKIQIPESTGYRFTRNLEQENKRVLLILDNVGKLNGEGFTRDVRDHLRGLSEGENACLKLVLAANEPLKQLFNDSQFNGNTSPLEDICQQVDILPWNEIIIRDFITKRLEPTFINFTEADIQALIQESAGNPRTLTQLCYQKYSQYLANI